MKRQKYKNCSQKEEELDELYDQIIKYANT